jgi:hypothetical protein
MCLSLGRSDSSFYYGKGKLALILWAEGGGGNNPQIQIDIYNKKKKWWRERNQSRIVIVTRFFPFARAAKSPKSPRARSKALFMSSNSITTSPMSSAASDLGSRSSSVVVFALFSGAPFALVSPTSSTLRFGVEEPTADGVPVTLVRRDFVGFPGSSGVGPLPFRGPADSRFQSTCTG